MCYYEEMGNFLKSSNEHEEALKCWNKALELAIELHGETSFRTVDCHLSLAGTLETLGRKEEADAAMALCLSNFDAQEQRSDLDSSTKRSHEASLLQKIGICFRERKEFERSCELLERVL